MKSEIEINDELIAGYLSGAATPEEALALEDWLTIPANKIHFEKFESVWNASAASKKPVFNSAEAWKKIDSSINVGSNKPEAKVLFLGFTKQTLRIAASFLVLAVSVVLIVLNFKKEEKYSTIATAEGTLTVKLSDHSVVTLNHHSALDYPVEFKKNTRELILKKGEAFFEVSPDKQKPFIVHTQVADIRVVGTSFNVITTQDQTEISVREGKVWVKAGLDSALLTKGSTALFTLGKAASIVEEEKESNVWGYATHKLVFKDTPLKTAIKDIEKAYTCSISVANKNIGKCKLTATFDRDEVDKVINLIAEILNLKVKHDGKKFTLEGDGCP
jgi:ferric-dicitrate binding protein FerR (iron transport regulator)